MRALGRLVLTGSGVWWPLLGRWWPSRPANGFRGETGVCISSCQSILYACWRLTVGAWVSTGLRRNTAAMLELRCCCWPRDSALVSNGRLTGRGFQPVRGRLVTEALGRELRRFAGVSVDLRVSWPGVEDLPLCPAQSYIIPHDSAIPPSASHPCPRGLCYSPLSHTPHNTLSALSQARCLLLEPCRAHNVCAAWPSLAPSSVLPPSLPRAQKAPGV